MTICLYVLDYKIIFGMVRLNVEALCGDYIHSKFLMQAECCMHLSRKRCGCLGHLPGQLPAKGRHTPLSGSHLFRRFHRHPPLPGLQLWHQEVLRLLTDQVQSGEWIEVLVQQIGLVVMVGLWVWVISVAGFASCLVAVLKGIFNVC